MTMLKDKLAALSGGRILDVATQGGDFMATLKDAFKHIEEVVGIDITDKDFDEAREKFKNEPVSFVVMNGASLEFVDESFDTVAMAAGMHHLANIPAVLSEMMRVLKPGGTFVLREMYRDDQDDRQTTDVMQHDWYAAIDRLLGIPHFPTLTRREIVDYAKGLELSRLKWDKRLCDDCPRSAGETVDEEIVEMNEQLVKVKEHPEYDDLNAERDRIIDRIRSVGIACSTSLDIVGVK